MFSILYKKHKYLLWGIVFLMFSTGALSKYLRGMLLDTYINGACAFLVIIILLFIYLKDKKNGSRRV